MVVADWFDRDVSELCIERVRGDALVGHLRELAVLRIAVFREYPYLYEGSLDYEMRYLARYAETTGSHLVIARDAERVVGASTCTPLVGQSADVLQPFRQAGYDLSTVCYFGESVLLPEYRGRGLGHAFFNQREEAAREAGFRWATFCAVVRGHDHPRKPKGYVPHDAFWGKRGFVRRPELSARFSWRDLGENEESAKDMVFWTRELAT
ncbi:MAG: GNAT family N-acetyltransferase [Myxococcales bacterium]